MYERAVGDCGEVGDCNRQNFVEAFVLPLIDCQDQKQPFLRLDSSNLKTKAK